MIIEKVELENIVSHKKTVVEFGPGITVIVGPNGAGKTGIIDAITYALFSFHSRESRRKDAIIRMGASRASVKLTFSVHGRRYIVEKVLTRGQTTQARLYECCGGSLKLRATGVRAVEAEIEKILGISREVAKATFVARQGEIDLLLEDRKARLDFINAVLGLEKIEKARERLPELLTKWAYRRGVLEKELETLRTQIRSLEVRKGEILKLKAKVEGLKGELGKVEEELEAVRRRLDEVTSRLEAAREARHRLEELEKLRVQLENEMSSLRRQLEEARKAEEVLRTIEKLQPLIRDLKTLRDLLSRKAELERLVTELRSRMEEYTKLVKELRSLEEYARRYEELKEQVNALKSVYEEYRASLVAVQEKEDLLLRLEDRKALLMDELTKLLKEVSEVLSSASTILRAQVLTPPSSEGEGRKQLARRAVDYASHCLEMLASIERERKTEVERLRMEMGKIVSRLDDLSKKLEELSKAKGVCPLCNQPLTEEHRIRMIKKLSAEKRKLQHDLSEIRTKLEHAKSELGELEKVKMELTSLSSRISSVARELESVEENLATLRSELEGARRKVLELVGMAKQYEDFCKELGRLEDYYKKYLQTKARVDELRRSIEGARDYEAELRKVEEEVKNILAKYGVELEEALELASRLDELERRQMELASKAGAIKVLEERCRELQDRLKELERELAKLRTVAESAAALEALSGELKSKEAMLEARRQELMRELSESLGALKTLEAELAKLDELKRRYEEVRSKLEAANRVYNFLIKLKQILSPDGLPKVVRSLAKSIVEDALRRVLSEFSLDYIDVKLDDDFEVRLITREGEKPATMLSGGERVVVALALRLALMQLAASNISVLIMDEPTIHLDAERKRELVNAIRKSFAASKLSQLIVVTHDPELEEAADTVITVFKVGGVSQVTVKKHVESPLTYALA